MGQPPPPSLGDDKEFLDWLPFNLKLPLVLATGASLYGIFAVPSHVMPDNTEKLIGVLSRTLNNGEKGCTQVDKTL